MISALAWVPRGASKAIPLRFEISQQEIDALKRVELAEEDEDRDALETAKLAARAVKGNTDGTNTDQVEDELPAYLKMDEYDDTPSFNLTRDNDEDDSNSDDIEDIRDEMDSDVDEDGAMVDEEVKIGDDIRDPMAMAIDDFIASRELNVNSEPDSDDEDHVIRPDDAVLLAAATEEDEHAVLMVHVYDQEGSSLYVHHDITLPSLPLCMAWMDLAPQTFAGESPPLGSYVAIGTFEPGIEIWNLDILDPLEPTAVLGGWAPNTAGGAGAGGKKKKKKGGSKPEYVEGSHTDAVIGMSWNGIHRQVLASGGADNIVKIWDITTQKCSANLTHHSDKVQSVSWHKTEPSILASASYDGKLAILDVRSMGSAAMYPLGSDPECLVWDPHDGAKLFTGTEDGAVACWDVRKIGAPPLYRFTAHSTGVSALSVSPHHKGFLATCGEDKSVRLWDSSKACEGTMPVLLTSKSMAVGRLFAVSFYPGTPFLLATGGSKGQVALWHTDDERIVADRFDGNVPLTKEDKLIEKLRQQEEDDKVIAAIEGMSVKPKTPKKTKKKKSIS